MSAMLRGAVQHAQISHVASVILVFVAVLFVTIALWAVRKDMANEFARASRLPFGDDAPKPEKTHG